MRREPACDRQHRAVAAQDDCEIGRAGQRIVADRVHAFDTGSARRVGVERHRMSACAQERDQLGERRRDTGPAMAADERNSREPLRGQDAHPAIKP